MKDPKKVHIVATDSYEENLKAAQILARLCGCACTFDQESQEALDSETAIMYSANYDDVDGYWIFDKTSITLEELEAMEREHNGELNEMVSPWISVQDRLPEEYKHRMSRDVLIISGDKMSVKSYDWELGRWNGWPHETVTHWMPLPNPPKH